MTRLPRSSGIIVGPVISILFVLVVLRLAGLL